jgi:hypothetical protein
MKTQIAVTVTFTASPPQAGVPADVVVPAMKAAGRWVKDMERRAFGHKLPGSRVALETPAGMIGEGGEMLVRVVLVDQENKPVECEVPE